MDPEFWHRRWAEGRIGWHQPEVNALLRAHWPALGLADDSRVFVPLCGKSGDMAWLVEQGHRVLGVDLVAAACAAFFRERGLTPEHSRTARFEHFATPRIELRAGDVFDLSAADLADCDACYDRAALIALPADMRRRYVDRVLARLPRGCAMLLVTLDYPPGEKEGPPFAVGANEVERLFAPDWRIELCEHRDILAQEPGFIAEGVSRLHTSAWHLRKQSAASTEA